ncbi:MAG: ArsR family transcriptional regulator [Proteobacteria bacterium]|nr:ArsR family transcriptional regulator [Pseudomonadota bacterium]
MADTDSEAIRVIVQGQIIECLNRFYAIETGMWGGPLDALIIRTVVVGEMQGKLYDISALAYALDIPLSTVHRKTRELEEAGFLHSHRQGRSTYWRPTARTSVELDKSFAEMISTLERLYRSPSPCGALLHASGSRTQPDFPEEFTRELRERGRE